MKSTFKYIHIIFCALFFSCSHQNFLSFNQKEKPLDEDSLFAISPDIEEAKPIAGNGEDLINQETEALKKGIKNANIERVGENIRVSFESGILFETDSYTLGEEAKHNIEKLSNIIKEFNNAAIVIEGHTDIIGSATYNQKLSEKRAQAVARYVEQTGVESEKITIKGYGLTKPIADNKSESGKSKNRRVEITILGNNGQTPPQAWTNNTIYISDSDSACYYSENSQNLLARRLCDSWQDRNGQITVNPLEAGSFNFTPISDPLGSIYLEEDVQKKAKTNRKKNGRDKYISLKGKAYNPKNGQPLSAEIEIIALSDGHEVVKTTSNPETGEFSVRVPAGGHYSYRAKSPGHISVHENIYVPHDQPYIEINQDLFLVPIEKGQKISLNNVFFHQGKAELLPPSYPELDEVVKLMQENPKIAIELNGHTDNHGNPYTNLKLSEKRVEAIKNYMEEQGVSPKRISLKAYGGTRPIASNEREETRKLNRRVEFVIVQK